MKYTLRQPACTGCPHDLYFGEAIKKQFGVMMHCGDVRPDRTEVEVEERRTEKGPTP